MGATVTTFCNETNIILYTTLSIVFPYYSTDSLLPGTCVNYTVGRVWFTATAEIWIDTRLGFIYFPTTLDEAVGLRYGLPFRKLDYLTYVKITPEEADKVMVDGSDFVQNDLNEVFLRYKDTEESLKVLETGYYANKNKKITITGGPKAVIYKPNPYFKGKHCLITSTAFLPLKMTITAT